jgi:hypothetical protein
MGERRVLHSALMGKSERKRPLGRPKPRWENNIKMDFRKWNRGSWTGLIWFRIGTGGRLLYIL